MKKVFIYVGHSNWGKSSALKIITGNNRNKKTVLISQYNVRVRKMSNDDKATGLYDWVKTFPVQTYDRFIIAFCPNLPASPVSTQKQNIALNVLTELQKTNNLYFFVQEEKFNYPQKKISPQEINWLKTFGTVHTLSGQNADTVRASEFFKFITLHI